MYRCSLPSVTVAVALCVLTSSAFADDVASTARFRLNPVQPASAHSPFLVVEGPVRAQHASMPWLAGTLIIDYARSPLSLDIDDPDQGARTVPLVDDAFVVHTNVAAHLSEGIAVDASWSVAALQAGENEPVGIREFEAPGSGAIGDLRLGALHRGWFSDDFGHVVGLRGWAPTGNEQNYMSDGRFRFELLAGLFAAPGALRFGCTLFGSPLFSTKESGERIGGGCAADVQTSEQGPRVGAEVWGAALFIDPDLDAGSILEYMGTVGQDAGPLRLTFGVGRGAGNSPGTSALRVIGMIGIVPQPSVDSKPVVNQDAEDRDLDGIANADDACPDEAGPESKDSAQHGCPSRDSDGDGIDDRLDACPQEKGAAQDDAQASGCPDKDNDRVVDKLDRCPTEPAPPYTDSTNPGCPKHARIRGDQFDLSPALDPLGSQGSVDQIVLSEVAFILRAMPQLKKIAVEVRLTVPSDEDETEVADLAVARADSFVQRLVDLGVERERLDPVGALSSDKSDVRIFIVERKDPSASQP